MYLCKCILKSILKTFFLPFFLYFVIYLKIHLIFFVFVYGVHDTKQVKISVQRHACVFPQ